LRLRLKLISNITECRPIIDFFLYLMPPKSLATWLALDQADPSLDWQHAEVSNLQDSRLQGAPCYGNHSLAGARARTRNQHGVSWKCTACSLRLLYVGAPGSSGKYRAQTTLNYIDASKLLTPALQELSSAAALCPAPAVKMTRKKKQASSQLPVWNGKPSDWEDYQREIEERLAMQELAPPSWNGTSETWGEYQEEVNLWMKKDEVKQEEDKEIPPPTSAASSSSGPPPPAPVKIEKATPNGDASERQEQAVDMITGILGAVRRVDPNLQNSQQQRQKLK